MAEDIRLPQYQGEELVCTQCGFETPEDEFREGVCEDCWEINQRAVDTHNAEFDRWEAMTGAERASEIRRTGRNG